MNWSLVFFVGWDKLVSSAGPPFPQSLKRFSSSGGPVRRSAAGPTLQSYLAEMSFRCGSASVVRGIVSGELGPA